MVPRFLKIARRCSLSDSVIRSSVALHKKKSMIKVQEGRERKRERDERSEERGTG